MPGQSAIDIAADPSIGPRRWIVPGILPERSWQVFASQAKAGKTYLTMWLARQVACGGPYFGHQVAAVMPVKYVFLERGYRDDVSLRWRLLGLPAPGEVAAADLTAMRAAYSLECYYGRSGLHDALNDVTQLGQRGTAGLLIVDTLARWAVTWETDERDNRAVTAFCERVEAIVMASGWSIVTPHHYPHNEQRMRGASAWGAGCNGWHNIAVKDAATRIVQVEHNEGPPVVYGYRMTVEIATPYNAPREVMRLTEHEVTADDLRALDAPGRRPRRDEADGAANGHGGTRDERIAGAIREVLSTRDLLDGNRFFRGGQRGMSELIRARLGRLDSRRFSTVLTSLITDGLIEHVPRAGYRALPALFGRNGHAGGNGQAVGALLAAGATAVQDTSSESPSGLFGDVDGAID